MHSIKLDPENRDSGSPAGSVVTMSPLQAGQSRGAPTAEEEEEAQPGLQDAVSLVPGNTSECAYELRAPQ